MPTRNVGMAARWEQRKAGGARPALAWGSGGDQLPGQCDLDGITVLVEHIQARFGHVGPKVDCETMIFLAIRLPSRLDLPRWLR